MRKIFAGLFTSLAATTAQANICGTDFQSFNPTTSGLDFVTVQSSETLRPCVINTGVFLNYAKNSLTYSRTVNPSYQSGQQRKDHIVGMDLSIGTGITKRWDFGLNIPIVLSQEVQDDAYTSALSNGVTELKANTKYRLLGDENGGLAGIVSLNKNLIEDNPFTGRDAGLTWNYELVADTVFAKKWAAAVNFGYRDRNPGETIPNLPYVPMGDQWIYSIAASYLIASVDTKIIGEIYGSRAADSVNPGTDRPLNALEGLLGVKHDYSQNLAMHLGATRRIDQALGGAEWRVYAGFNLALGPVCNTAVVEKVDTSSVPQTREGELEILKLDVELLFKTNSDTLNEEFLVGADATLNPFLTNEFTSLLIEGHTDSVGAEEYNQKLSEKRAGFIEKYLISKYKLDAKKVESVGRGETVPIADNGNYQGRRKNRRVELKIWRRGKQEVKRL